MVLQDVLQDALDHSQLLTGSDAAPQRSQDEIAENMERLLAHWSHRAKEMAAAHERHGCRAARMHALLSQPVMLLTILMAAAMAPTLVDMPAPPSRAASKGPRTGTSWAVVGAPIAPSHLAAAAFALVAIWQTVLTIVNLPAQRERHFNAAARYSEIVTDIEQLALDNEGLSFKRRLANYVELALRHEHATRAIHAAAASQ